MERTRCVRFVDVDGRDKVGINFGGPLWDLRPVVSGPEAADPNGFDLVYIGAAELEPKGALISREEADRVSGWTLDPAQFDEELSLLLSRRR